MTNVGRPKHFPIEAWLTTVDGYINADEVELALWILDHPPKYFQDHYPERAQKLKDQLMRDLWTPIQYAKLYKPMEWNDTEGRGKYPLRFEILDQHVAEINRQGFGVHIMELAPGQLIAPNLLRSRKRAFSYECQGLEEVPHDFHANHGLNEVDFFVCHELIEHLPDETEIYRNYLKLNREASVVMLSTPLYTYAGGHEDWRGHALGHLRTYSPKSFYEAVTKMFHGYKLELFTGETMVIVGTRG